MNWLLRIKETLQVLMVKRLFEMQKVPYSELFELATNKKSLYAQYHHQYPTCKHKCNWIDDGHSGFYLANYKSTEKCLQYPICMVWFHNDCFHKWLPMKRYHISIILYLTKFSLFFSDYLICAFQWISLILFHNQFPLYFWKWSYVGRKI